MSLSRLQQVIIGLLLIVLMVITRGHHFASISHLPSASWAVFFLAGLYISRKWFFPGLLAVAGILDYVAITSGGVSSFCISPAYALLIPAYGTLWLAGHWYAKQYQFSWSTLLPLSLSVFVASVVSQIISSGGFYFFSGRFADTTFVELSQRLITYYPSQISSLVFYLSITAFCHICFILIADSTSQQEEHNS